MKTQNVRNILVPIDFSKMSIQAIETAKRLAQRFGATVHLAHVRQFYYSAGFTAPMPSVVPFSVVTNDQEAEKTTSRQLNALAAKHGLSRATCHLLSGAPAFDEICRLAQEIPADLIVMPTHGHAGLKHVLLGSTAERIVQHSPCPVLVTRGAPHGIHKILVPVDFSSCSLEGLKYAIEFTGRVAKVIVFHAVYPGYAYTADGYAMCDFTVVTDALRKDAERQMREFLRAARFRSVKFEAVTRVGPPVDEICAFAQAEDVDLIITATHGRTGFKHVLIGSIAERVVRHAPCAVLVVPSHPGVRALAVKSSKVGRKKSVRHSSKTRPLEEEPEETAQLTRRSRKLKAHAFPERRKTNRFREWRSS